MYDATLVFGIQKDFRYGFKHSKIFISDDEIDSS